MAPEERVHSFWTWEVPQRGSSGLQNGSLEDNPNLRQDKPAYTDRCYPPRRSNRCESKVFESGEDGMHEMRCGWKVATEPGWILYITYIPPWLNGCEWQVCGGSSAGLIERTRPRSIPFLRPNPFAPVHQPSNPFPFILHRSSRLSFSLGTLVLRPRLLLGNPIAFVLSSDFSELIAPTHERSARAEKRATGQFRSSIQLNLALSPKSRYGPRAFALPRIDRKNARRDEREPSPSIIETDDVDPALTR